MTITAKQMEEALQAGYNVTVIVNGEYYGFAPEGMKEVEEYFKTCLSYWRRQGCGNSQAMSRALWWDCAEVWNIGKSWTPAKIAFFQQYRRQYTPYSPIPEEEAVKSGAA